MTISTELIVAIVTGAFAIILAAIGVLFSLGNKKELSSLATLKAQMESTQTNLAVLKGIIEELRIDNTSQRKLVDDLKSIISQKDVEYRDLLCRVQELERDLASKNTDLTNRDRRIVELEAEVKRQDQELISLREKVAILEGRRKTRPLTNT